MIKRHFITTAIDYPNGEPHLGQHQAQAHGGGAAQGCRAGFAIVGGTRHGVRCQHLGTTWRR